MSGHSGISNLIGMRGRKKGGLPSVPSSSYPDPAARTLLVRHDKGGKSRLLPVGERAAAWLDRYLTESRPQFSHLPRETAMFLSGYGTRITPAYLGTWVSYQMKLAGITTKGSCHLFRHSCATAMHTGGADIRYVQEMLEVCPCKQSALATPSNRPGNPPGDDPDPPSCPVSTQPLPTPTPPENPANKLGPSQSGKSLTSTRNGHLNYYIN